MVQIPLSAGSSPNAIQTTADVIIPPLEPLFLPWTLVFDDREREGGWKFQGLAGNSKDKYRPLVIKQECRRLLTADYTIDGCPVFIERKSKDDILGSITHGHDRFRAEHCRMQEIVAAGGKCFVVIEANFNEVIEELASGTSSRQIHPASLEGICASWPAAFSVPWYWCGDRRTAEKFAFRLLRTWHERLTN